MHLLFTRFPLESRYGGAEVQTLTLMKGLRERGHEVTFLGSCPVLLKNAKELGIRNQELWIGEPPVTKRGAISFLWRQWGMKRLLKAQVSRLKADVIFMLSLSEKLLLTEWLTNQGVKVFWIEHDRVGRWLTRNPWLPRLRRLAKLATTVVVSDLSRDIYLQLGFPPERVVSIPNGIDLSRFAPQESGIRNQESGQLHIGCVARLTRDKGVDLLLEAIADLPDVHLRILGEGPELLKLKDLTRTRELLERATFEPATTDVVSFYRSLDALVLPSRDHDPFGLAALEAMACGIPVVVTDACGIARHLQPGEALIVPAGSSQALREAMVKLRDPHLHSILAQAGRAAVVDRFSATKMTDRYAALLEER